MIDPLTNKKTNCIFKLHDIFNLGFIQERLTINEIRNIFQKLRIFNFYEHITLKKMIGSVPLFMRVRAYFLSLQTVKLKLYILIYSFKILLSMELIDF